MTVFPDMKCCKPGRQFAGLSCDPGWMLGCLAAECAKQTTLEVRRRFAAQVSGVRLLADPALQEQFRAEVKRLYEARKSTA